MKLMFLSFALAFSVQSFAFEAIRGESGHFYVKCQNGDSGGKYTSKDAALSDGARLCAGRERFRYAPAPQASSGDDRGRREHQPIRND